MNQVNPERQLHNEPAQGSVPRCSRPVFREAPGTPGAALPRTRSGPWSIVDYSPLAPGENRLELEGTSKKRGSCVQKRAPRRRRRMIFSAFSRSLRYRRIERLCAMIHFGAHQLTSFADVTVEKKNEL